MIQKIKEFIIGIISLLFLVIILTQLLDLTANHRNFDKHYACSGYSGSIPKVFSFHYNRHYSLPWADKGYLEVTLESNWYDFAAFYYIDQDGNLDEKIMDSAIKAHGAGLTSIKDTTYAYSLKRKLSFNRKTNVVSLENETGVIFTGICTEVK